MEVLIRSRLGSFSLLPFLFLAACDDGVLDRGEACDDGNNTDADGCEADCSLPACQSGIADPGELCFEAAVALEEGFLVQPTDVALGDIDGDGDLDLVSTREDLNNVGVRLGNGDGSFSAPVNLPAGSGPQSVALGDLNGDGDPDLAVTGFSASKVAVLFGNGAGAFTTPLTLVAGDGPESIELGDVDLDGRLDVVVANQDSDDISVFTSVVMFSGIGNGFFFGPEPLFATEQIPESLATGDVDGDPRNRGMITRRSDLDPPRRRTDAHAIRARAHPAALQQRTAAARNPTQPGCFPRLISDQTTAHKKSEPEIV